LLLPLFCTLQKGCTRLAAASDKVYLLLAHGRWFSPGTPASSATKTGHDDIVEILLKVALNTKNHHNQIFDLRLLVILLVFKLWEISNVLSDDGLMSTKSQGKNVNKT